MIWKKATSGKLKPICIFTFDVARQKLGSQVCIWLVCSPCYENLGVISGFLAMHVLPGVDDVGWSAERVSPASFHALLICLILARFAWPGFQCFCSHLRFWWHWLVLCANQCHSSHFSHTAPNISAGHSCQCDKAAVRIACWPIGTAILSWK